MEILKKHTIINVLIGEDIDSRWKNWTERAHYEKTETMQALLYDRKIKHMSMVNI